MAVTTTRRTRVQAQGISAVRTSTIVMIGFAVLFGLLAVFIAQSWLNSQAEMRMRSLEAQKKPVATQTIVVASKSLRFGNELGRIVAARDRRGRKTRCRPAPSRKISDVMADERPPRRAHRDRGERADPRVQDHRAGPARDAVGDAAGRHAGRHHSRQRRRRRRRLRAAGRSRRRRADAPEATRRPVDHRRGAAEHARARDRPDRRRAHRQAVDRARRSRSKSIPPAAQKLALAASVGTLSLMLRQAGEASVGDDPRASRSAICATATCRRQQERAFATITVSDRRRATEGQSRGLQRADRRSAAARSAADAQARAIGRQPDRISGKVDNGWGD